MQWLLANFGAEIDMAARITGASQPRLPHHVQKRLGQIARKLSVVAPQAIIVATLTDEQIAAFDSGSALSSADGPSRIAAWAETDAVCALRDRLNPSESSQPATPASETWLEEFWNIRAKPAVVRTANDRRSWLALAAENDWLLPGTQLIHSLDELVDLLPTLVKHSAENAWLARAPFGAAGRERVYRWGTSLSADIEIRLSRLIERYGSLVCAPMMKRLVDVGVCAFIGESQTLYASPHRLHTDAVGVFRSIERKLPLDIITAVEQQAIVKAAHICGNYLHQIGYRGPFGIDAFVYENIRSHRVVHPACEINARLTFGHLSWAERLREAAS